MIFQLEILTNLATETNIATILRELQVIFIVFECTFIRNLELKIKLKSLEKYSYHIFFEKLNRLPN